MLTHYEMILRIILAAVLGGFIGLERDMHGRPVGLRTHLLVAMAAGTFMILSSHFFYFQNYDDKIMMGTDPSRIASTVVSGIGFLAGGAILKTGLSIQGLTTAAGLWLVTAIGMCAGAGMYIESIAVTVMGLIALTVFRRFEDKNDKLLHRKVFLEFEETENTVDLLMKAISEIGATVEHFDYKKKMNEQALMIQFDAFYPKEVGHQNFILALENQKGLKSIHVGSVQSV